MKKLIITLLLLLFSFNLPVYAKDIKGSGDHKLVGRFAGSEIVGYKVTPFDEYILAENVPAKENKWTIDDKTTLEGKITEILYKTKKGVSTLEVFKNYEKKLKANGFKKRFTCKQKGQSGCGSELLNKASALKTPLLDYAYSNARDHRYITMKKTDPKGDIYVAMMVYNYGWDFFQDRFNHTFVLLNIIEVKPLDDDQIEVITAEKISKQVADQGRIALYGIYFDTGKSELKAQSKETLQQIQQVLSSQPDLKLHVVGHTDNKGAFAYNMTLSRDRANAVKAALVANGIKSDRLTANGVASLAPITSNATEEGRAKNRRVELVAQ